MPIIGGILSFLGSCVQGFFGLKTEQQQTIKSALDIINNVNTSDKDRAIAFAQYMTAEANSGYWLAACIRPLTALLLLILVSAWFFGYAPPNIDKAMPPFIGEAIDMLKVYMGFYVTGRSLEKITNSILNSRMITLYVTKILGNIATKE